MHFPWYIWSVYEIWHFATLLLGGDHSEVRHQDCPACQIVDSLGCLSDENHPRSYFTILQAFMYTIKLYYKVIPLLWNYNTQALESIAGDLCKVHPTDCSIGKTIWIKALIREIVLFQCSVLFHILHRLSVQSYHSINFCQNLGW